MPQRDPSHGSGGGRAPRALGRVNRQMTLVSQVERVLRDAINRGRFPGEKLPTEVELAEQLGVSRETVRRATEELVAEGLLVKYRRKGTFLRDPAAMQLAMISSTLIGYLQADYRHDTGEDTTTRAISGAMLQGAVEAADVQGFQLLVRRATPAELAGAYREMSQRTRPRGLIFASVAEEKLLRQVLGSGIPAVLLDHELHLPKVSTVRSDSAGAAAAAVKYLAQRGHRRIALAYWNLVDLNPWGLEGYRAALRELGLARRRKWEWLVELDEQGAAEVADSIASLEPRPTAVVCFNNTQARLIIAALSSRGLSVPDDVSVVGCGGEAVAGLTCFQADWFGMGRTAAQLLLRTMTGRKGSQSQHHVTPHLLQEGRTVRNVDV